MKFSLNIESEDDAAVSDPVATVSRVLQSVATTFRYADAVKLQDMRSLTGSLHDRNGNRIGSWEYSMRDKEL